MGTTVKVRRRTHTLGHKLQYLRRIKRLTQEELALKTGLSVATISNLESDRHIPTIRTLRALDEALGQAIETVEFEVAS